LLLKLKAIGIPFLRLGSKHQVHPELHQYIFNFDGSIRTVEDIESMNELFATSLSLSLSQSSFESYSPLNDFDREIQSNQSGSVNMHECGSCSITATEI
jgi:fido (protein-threonine AMPylation protein)